MYTLKPTLEEVTELLQQHSGNTIPIYQELPADLLTPVSAYLKLAQTSDYSFLLESAVELDDKGRYSFVGTDPYEVIRMGPHEATPGGDPLLVVQDRLAHIRYVPVPGLPRFTGGAVGYIAFDCVKYFEPAIVNKSNGGDGDDLRDPHEIPESVFMMMDQLVIFDRRFNLAKVVAHIRTDDAAATNNLAALYDQACARIARTVSILQQDHTPLPPQPPIRRHHTSTSNLGQVGYEGIVEKLKRNIVQGDIFQAVPSQRVARPTDLHPFNAYRYIRTTSPVPYMFYLNLRDFQVVGASPEMLVSVDRRVVTTHPIAGTRKRGRTPAEDQALADDLLSDEKERAEHVMLVDLGRNDVNRVCQPKTVKVDSLMQIERYSNVMHIVSKVSGSLRADCTPFDAFRSIFPAGTVSGAPKVRALQLIRGYEGEKRGVYAGAVGHFDFSGDLDTCIAIRTMVFKDGVAYLQAGGGIVYDSEPTAEWEETVNKMRSTMNAIEGAELHHLQLQGQSEKARK